MHTIAGKAIAAHIRENIDTSRPIKSLAPAELVALAEAACGAMIGEIITKTKNMVLLDEERHFAWLVYSAGLSNAVPSFDDDLDDLVVFQPPEVKALL